MATPDQLAQYRTWIEQVLAAQTTIPYAHGEIALRTCFDRVHDQYLVVTLGWAGERRIHGCLIHLEIIAGKVWIQRDGTEDGVATALVAAGIPPTAIVLGFRPPELRRHTAYAAA